jgi:hypothetical protein
VRGWAIAGAIVGGVIVLTAVVAAASNGRDHTGETVREQAWATDVCGTVGAWEGQIEDIANALGLNTEGGRMADNSGDTNENAIGTQEAIDRAIRATDDVLQEGLKRAGTPDTPDGDTAASILRNWAQDTENDLLAAKATLKQEPKSPSASYDALAQATKALKQSGEAGRDAFARISTLDPELADAIGGSRDCRKLMVEQP